MKKTFVILVSILLSSPIFAQPTISLNSVITGLSQPIQFVNAGDGTNRIFIPQKGGVVNVYDKNFVSLGTFLTISSISTGGEQGLLSMCFHPQYKTNGLFFIYYTNTLGNLEIARYKVGSGNDSINLANTSSKKIVITVPHPTFSNHNGGTLRFGRDGYLYLSTGDGGSGGDPINNSQTTTSLLGKMLRLNVNTSESAPYYSIPPGNPFSNEVLAYGLRNPFRWNFDRLTGDMWIGDVGQNAFEEINRCHRDSLAGVNYGWRCYEGNNAYNTSGCGAISNYKFPVLTYPNTGSSVVGGTVYRGETYLSMKGYYLGADFYSGKFYKIKYDSLANSYNISTQIISPNGMSDFGETENGELFATNLFNGNVYRIQSNGPIQYTFIGNGNWTDAANWSNNTIPPSNSLTGSIIVIRPVAGGECIVNVPVTIAIGTKILIENNKQLRMNSNLVIQ
jgi:glucose/arabinose dehydrogenase